MKRICLRRARARGFTLLEILVALAVIAVALAAALKASGEGASNAAHLRDRTLAHWVAMNTVTELQIARSWPALGRTTGAARMAGKEWFWAVTTAATPDDAVRRLDVEVRATERDGPALGAVTAYVGNPEDRDP